MLKLTQEEGTSGRRMGKDNETGHHKKIKITETSLDTQRRMTDGMKRVAVPITEIWKQGS